MTTTYYKTLINGRSFHGGEFEYSLPKNGKPGKWHKITEPLVMCRVGFHLTTTPANWWEMDAKCYEAEYRGEVLTEQGSDKICVAEVRLVREIDPETVQIFYSGSHQVNSGKCLAYNSATVKAYGSATVEAYNSATVEAYNSAMVEACDSAMVKAYNSAMVKAYNSAMVKAYNSATVKAYDSATVEAYDSATVNITRWATTPSVSLGDAAVCIDRRTSPPTVTGNFQTEGK